MLYKILVEAHSGVRYLVLLLLIVVIVKSLMGLINKSPFAKADNLADNFQRHQRPHDPWQCAQDAGLLATRHSTGWRGVRKQAAVGGIAGSVCTALMRADRRERAVESTNSGRHQWLAHKTRHHANPRVHERPRTARGLHWRTGVELASAGQAASACTQTVARSKFLLSLPRAPRRWSANHALQACG